MTSVRLPVVCRVSTGKVRESGDGEKRILQAGGRSFPSAPAQEDEYAWVVKIEVRRPECYTETKDICVHSSSSYQSREQEFEELCCCYYLPTKVLLLDIVVRGVPIRAQVLIL